MTLGERLKTLVGMLGNTQKMADIGSDHAKLPVWLVQNGIVECAVAGEVSCGPFQAAQKNVLRNCLQDKVLVRLGDGLQVIESGEVDTVVIAGMGGAAIKGILERSPDVLLKLRRIVLQPMNGFLVLRKFLKSVHWDIVDEQLVKEDGRIYVAIAAIPGTLDCNDEFLLEVGPLLWQQRHPLFKEYLIEILETYRKQIASMEKSTLREVELRRKIWQGKVRKLEEMVQCF